MTIEDIERACKLAELAGGGVGVTLTAPELRFLLDAYEQQVKWADEIVAEVYRGRKEVEQQAALLAEARGVMRELLEGYELDYSGCDTNFTFSPEEWDRRIDAGKAFLAKLGAGEREP